jgi:hypothetical protein
MSQNYIAEGAMGLDLNPIPIEQKITQEYLQSRVHYVFYYGSKNLPINQIRCKKPFLRPGVIEQINNFRYPDRRQVGGDNADYNEGESAADIFPGRKEPDLVWRTNRAGVICDDLKLLYGNTRGDDEIVGMGLIVLDNLTGIEPNIVQHIARALLPEVTEQDPDHPDNPKRRRVKSAGDMLVMIRAGRDQFAAAIDTPEYRSKQRETADRLIQAIEEAREYMRGHLDGIKGESESRRLAGGVGRGKFYRNERSYMRLIGKPEGDYVSDISGQQDQFAEKVIKILQSQSQQPQPAQSGMTPEVFAAAMQMAMQTVLQQFQQPPQSPPPAPPAPTAPPQQSNKQNSQPERKAS